MKLKIFCMILCVCIMVSGCGQKHTQNDIGSNIATRVEIYCISTTGTLFRIYTQPAKIEAVLIYLRLLHPRGPVQLPQEEIRQYYEIVVRLSDGSRRVHRQCADCYATTAQGWWGIIDSRHGEQLARLIQYIPSDTAPENPPSGPVTRS